MPRGVYVRKKTPAKRAAKKATPTARRPRRRVAEIPSISLSSLRSSASSTRTDDAPGTVVTELGGEFKAIPAPEVLTERSSFIVIDDNGEWDGETHSTYNRAEDDAKSEIKVRIEDNDGSEYTYEIYQLVAKVTGKEPERKDAEFEVKRAAPAL